MEKWEGAHHAVHERGVGGGREGWLVVGRRKSMSNGWGGDELPGWRLHSPAARPATSFQGLCAPLRSPRALYLTTGTQPLPPPSSTAKSFTGSPHPSHPGFPVRCSLLDTWTLISLHTQLERPPWRSTMNSLLSGSFYFSVFDASRTLVFTVPAVLKRSPFLCLSVKIVLKLALIHSSCCSSPNKMQ